MTVTAVTGANWGDEGKGKVVDRLAGEADMVVRFQGGRNAGHTVINEHGKFALHLLPSGIFHSQVKNVLGPGVALDLKAFFDELNMIKSSGLPDPDIFVSDRAQLVLDAHVMLDKLEEERLGESGFGSTLSGIAPFYADKYLKIGVQAADLYDPDRLRARLNRFLSARGVLFEHLYNRPAPSVDALAESLLEFAPRLKPYLCNTTELFDAAIKQDKTILLEGQLGALRDPDHGIYPFSTSSSPLAGFASVGAGIPARHITRVIAVAKAYSSCVGAGPFVTELFGDEAHKLREHGGDVGEYGATTGRPRRVGWFDAVATRYGCMVQGATEVTLSLLDVLGIYDEIKVCTGYMIDGKLTTQFPTTGILEKARPHYETLPGWGCDISDIGRFDDLPAAALAYVNYIEKLLGFPITQVSVGPSRDAMILK